MAEYIEKQAAIEACCYNCSESNICGGTCDDTDRIRNIPPADVRLVRRGMWVPVITSAFLLPTYECSRCEFDTGNQRFNFCPNCGADMREVGEDG